MGLLDEAIRQHLELKRSRGADPDEVARQEDEALGAVGVQEPVDTQADTDLGLVDAPESGEPAEPPAAHATDPAGEAGAPPREPEAVAAASEAPEDPPIDLQQPTVEFVVEGEPASHSAPAPEGEDEDVLEDTPEFLQETPEHDRLWFEQKPPRDFDF